MYCNQCEQTYRGIACESVGVCGKDEDVESLQQILLYGLKGMASYAHHARRLGKVDEEVDAFMEEGLFATVTNVNFDQAALFELILECVRMNLKLMELLNDGHVERYGQP
ncbi:MAG: hydroxylamine reductase, partial [Candidatus Omnitrophica bacterium]|nr:hydroxylamine reductase [Candidatus Omnitrophota bacterium]